MGEPVSGWAGESEQHKVPTPRGLSKAETAEAVSRGFADELLNFPSLMGTKQVAQRISPREAMDNLNVMEQLQGCLSTNVQEALALEVGLLKLHL